MITAPPPAQGLYDPAFEHDACGVAFVVDMAGRRSHTLVEQGITALVHLDHRGASGAETNTGDGAGITIQVPDRFYREVAGFGLPEAGHYATGIAFVPVTAPRSPRRSRRWRRSSPARAWSCSAGETCLWCPTSSAPVPSVPCPRSARSSWPPTGWRAWPWNGGSTWPASASSTRSARRASGCTSPACPPAPSPTRGCSPPRSSGPSTPTCPTNGWRAPWRWCTPGSPPTRSRRGRWRTPTGTWPTTARSTPSKATATGCAPARPCWPATSSATTWPRRSRSAPPAPATPPASTRCWSCCTWAGARCPMPCS